MKQKDFTTTILVDQSPEEVFNAVNNVGAWWPGEVNGDSQKISDEFSYRYKELHHTKQKLVEVVPNKKVVWLVTYSDLNYVDHKSEWEGTKIVFDITKKGSKTELRFTHEGLVPDVECYDSCSGAWTDIITDSLQSLITTGKGVLIDLG
ncbi:MAG: SRPBCC domain-containing protein [Chitinophagaceae bacterium]